MSYVAICCGFYVYGKFCFFQALLNLSFNAVVFFS